MLLALLEIQIEGPNGWAAKLPTWRARLGTRFDKLFKKFFHEKDLTGYFLALNTFLLVVFHMPFIWHFQWSIWEELSILSVYVIFAATWDFLWFVLNPKFSLRKFDKKHVWWHKKWWGVMPVDYYMAIILSIVFLLPETIMINPIEGIFKIVALLGLNIILISITIMIYPKAY